MHTLDLENVNWEYPSHQNIVDLYYARMWAISEAVALMLREDIPPSPLFIDDIRTNFLSLTRMNRWKFDSLIREGAHLLGEWGIPEVFVVSTSGGFGCEPEEGEYVNAHIYTEDDLEELDENDTMAENAAVLMVMQSFYPTCLNKSEELEKQFLELVKPKGGYLADEG